MGKKVPQYPDPRMVDPWWAIQTSKMGDMTVEAFLQEYNLLIPSEDELESDSESDSA